VLCLLDSDLFETTINQENKIEKKIPMKLPRSTQRRFFKNKSKTTTKKKKKKKLNVAASLIFLDK